MHPHEPQSLFCFAFCFHKGRLTHNTMVVWFAYSWWCFWSSSSRPIGTLICFLSLISCSKLIVLLVFLFCLFSLCDDGFFYACMDINCVGFCFDVLQFGWFNYGFLFHYFSPNQKHILFSWWFTIFSLPSSALRKKTDHQPFFMSSKGLQMRRFTRR